MSQPTTRATAVLVLSTALAGAVFAADYYVDNSTNACADVGPGTVAQPYCTIGAALAAHHDPGTTIHVLPGTYAEQVAIPASGTAGSPLVLQADTQPGAPVVIDGTTHNYGFTLTGRAWVVITGFHVTHCARQGILVEAGSSNVTLRNNTVDFCGTNGIALSGSSALEIDSNVCSDNGDHGMEVVKGTTGSTLEHNECMRNARPTMRAANGIYLESSPSNVIRWNNLHDNQDTGLQIDSDTTGSLSLENVSWHNGDHGYDHLHSNNVLHIGDVAYGNFKDGFSFEGGAFSNAVYDCIAIDNGLTTNEFDLWVDDTSHVGFQSDDNIFWNSTAQPPVKYVTTLYSSVAAYSVVSGQDGRTIQADPLFVDPANGDFHLRAGSPAIDSGNSAVPGWPALDFYGLARIDDPNTPNTGVGSIPYADRGAFEFGSALTGVADVAALASAPRMVPNPVRGAARLRFDTARGGALGVRLYDLRGRTVRTLVDDAAAAPGAHDVAFDGRGDDGRPLRPGVYFLQVRTAFGARTGQFIVTP